MEVKSGSIIIILVVLNNKPKLITNNGLMLVYNNYDPLVAINVNDGTKAWEYEPESTYKNGYDGYIHDVVIGDDGVIYLETNNNGILALNSDGSLRWVRYESEHSLSAERPMYLGEGNQLHIDRNGYISVSSDGLADSPWPYAYGDYSNQRLALTSDSQVTVPIVTNVVATAGNSKVSVSFSEVESASYYNVYYSSDSSMPAEIWYYSDRCYDHDRYEISPLTNDVTTIR